MMRTQMDPAYNPPSTSLNPAAHGNEQREEWGTRHVDVQTIQRIVETFPDRDAAVRHFKDLDEVWGHHAELIHRTVTTSPWEPVDPAAATIAERLSRFSYKPGWTIRVAQRQAYEGVWLLIDCPTVDAYDPARRLTLPGGRRITRAVEIMDDEQLTAWVLGLIDDIERHERDEWFRRDGQLVNDPHKPGGVTR